VIVFGEIYTISVIYGVRDNNTSMLIKYARTNNKSLAYLINILNILGVIVSVTVVVVVVVVVLEEVSNIS
jgi:hypothetical protein